MIVRLEKNAKQKDIEVLIKYPHMNQTVRRLESLMKSIDKTVKCHLESSDIWVKAADIYYIESVDKRTFVYTKTMVCQTEFRLYQLLEELMDVGFVQVSKSCIINSHTLDRIRPLRNSRMEATLSNGERINVTRKFISSIKEKLQVR